MKYEEVTDALMKAFPEFEYKDCSEGLPYCIAGDFARYLLNAYRDNDTSILAKAGDFIENLYSYGDNEVDNLAMVGFLEGIQNVWGNNRTNPDELLEYLGDKSKDGWLYLNRSWNGCDTCTEWFSKLL